jgi:uncharacterized ion transporter superfamily protein YfcC
MSDKKSFPGPIPILMIVIILAAVATWLLPAGQYNKLSVTGKTFTMATDSNEIVLPLTQKTLDSLGIQIKVEKFIDGDIRKPVSVPNSFTKQKRNQQGFIPVLQAPIKGIVDSIEIILFVLIIGGFMFVFNETGAMVKGITWLAHTMKGREQWLIAILTIVFSFFAGSYGMAEEALVFYPILVPLFLAAGYDLVIPLAIIFGGTSVGALAAFSNPFSTIIASNAAGINWMDGLGERLVLWAITTALLAWYLLRYAAKIKKDPTASLVYKIDGIVKPLYEVNISNETNTPALEGKTKLLLLIYVATFLTMIAGVVFLKWWTTEMSALFLGSSILVALITRLKEKIFIVYGRVPMFYYIIHFYVLCSINICLYLSHGHSIAEGLKGVPGMPWKFVVPGEGYSLGIVYLVWITVVVALYPLCKWYDTYKTKHKEKWWLSYL